MCLSVATSRKPLFTTAYKIMGSEYLGITGIRCASTLYQPGGLLINGEWNVNRRPDIEIPYDEYTSHTFYGEVLYKSGFHSFVKLEDAIVAFKYRRDIRQQNVGLYEVDTDEIQQYGVEKHWYYKNNKACIYLIDVVVSNKIKFNQKIEI